MPKNCVSVPQLSHDSSPLINLQSTNHPSRSPIFHFLFFSFFFIFKKNFHPPLSLHPIFSGYTCMHSIHTINTQDRSENSLFFRFFTHKLLDFTLFDVQTSQFFQDIHVYIVYTHSEHSLHTQDRRKKTPFFRLLHTYYTLVCDR